MGKVNSKETGRSVHSGDTGYGGCGGLHQWPGRGKWVRKGSWESYQGGSPLLPSPPKGALEPQTMKR